MAAAQELSFDDICTCSICLETFKIPKYLPCLHSFCETCLDTYIQSSINKKETSPSTGFQCPVCRTFVSIGDSAGSPNLWANQMPVNHLIMSMMDRRAIEKSEKFCDSCILNNTKEIACSWCVVCQEAFCATCEKYHRNFKMSSSHKIIEIKDRNLDLTDMFLSGTTVQCDQHKEKAIEVYCVDHAKPCCTLCATVNHRRCEKVVAIDEVVSCFKYSTQAKAISNILDEMSSKLEEIVQKRKENILQIEVQNDKILQSAVKLKDSVIKHLEKLDQTFRTELECATKQVLLPLKDDATVLSSYKCTIDNWRTILRSCLSYGSEIQYFVETNKIDYKQKQLDQDIRDLLSKMSTASLKFTPNLTLVEHQTGLTSLGKLEIDTVRFRQEGFLPKVNLKEGNIKIIQTIETCGSYTSGIFLRDFIILTDNRNNRVLKYDDKGVLLKSLSLAGGPKDVTRIDQDIVAVNEGYKCIVIIRVTDMVIQRKLDCTTFNTELVYGFQYVNNCFVCAYNNQITWINASTGAIVDTRKTEGDTWYLHASENQELIFTDGKKISKLFNGQLKLFYESKEIINPRGIDVDFEGNVYVCGFSSNNIHQLTREGKLIRIIPAATLGLINPWVLRFMENGNRFLLSQSTGGKVLICEIV